MENLMKKRSVILPLFTALAFALLTGCSSSTPVRETTALLSANDLNLVFVVSPDVDHQTQGDVDSTTGNLTSQGLQRSLRMATYLKQQLLGTNNVTGIYTLAPMTHLQTAGKYPDMAAIGFIQQFALLNRNALPLSTDSTYTANSYPLSVSYGSYSTLPDGVAIPSASSPGSSQGLDFKNTNGINKSLLDSIIKPNAKGYHVFSAPWETISTLLTDINELKGYNLNLPMTFRGSNYVYAISIAPSGDAKLVTLNSGVNPPSTYPVLPAALPPAACTYLLQPYFSTTRIGGVNGAVIPDNINRNQTVYIVRHAEAHPDTKFKFENGNFVAAGQWRALGLPDALRGKMQPTMVYSVDPAQWFYFPPLPPGSTTFSYVRPSLTVLPYAIANNLPYYLASSFYIGDDKVAQRAKDFFFTGGKLSNQTILLGWESGRINPLINALLDSYGGLAPERKWPGGDYDTIWTVKLDDFGNLSVSNDLCEGIDSAALPPTAPLF
jgi:hypothetical protein